MHLTTRPYSIAADDPILPESRAFPTENWYMRCDESFFWGGGRQPTSSLPQNRHGLHVGLVWATSVSGGHVKSETRGQYH